MQKNNSRVAIASPSLLPTLLVVLFVGLKLGGIGAVASWSWLWVLSPLWLPLVIAVAIVFVAVIAAGVVAAVKAIRDQ